MSSIFNINAYNTHDREKANTSNIPVCIPKDQYFMVAPVGDEAYWSLEIICIDRKWYLVNPDLTQDEHLTNVVSAVLYPAMMTDGSLFLLPVTAPYPNKPRSWLETWQKLIPLARRNWISVSSNSERNCHDHTITDRYPAPRWPEFDYVSLLEKAFAKRAINSMNDMRLANGKPRFETSIVIEEE